MSSTASATATATTSAAAAASAQPPVFKVVGVILAVVSGLLIGSSFVFKKKGLLASQGDGAGHGVAYLKSPMWWTGMTMMIAGELCNFGSYAFVPAIIVTPLGALSVVICAILSSIFLKESLTFFGWIGCFLCIVGSTIIALNGPQETSASTIKEFQHLFLSLGFIIYGSAVILSALIIIFFIAPKYGEKSMLWYILICSLFGGLSVSCTQGLGASIVTSVRGENQFKYWFIYFLLVFVAVTLVSEIFFLNKALALFNTAMVTPTYYVIFTFFTLVTSVILYQGLKATVVQIMTVVLGFLVICAGIVILQMSKLDPTKLKGLDRRSTILLQANREHVETGEKGDVAIEEPGMDALRGSFGAFGSIIRARSVRQASQNNGSNTAGRYGHRRPNRDEENGFSSNDTNGEGHGLEHMPRHQLYDAPVPRASSSLPSIYEGDDHRIPPITTTNATTPKLNLDNPLASPNATPRNQKIQFDSRPDIAHYYPSPGKAGTAVHEARPSHYSPRHPSPPIYDDEDPPFDPSRLRSSDRFAPQIETQRRSDNPFRGERESDPFRDDARVGSSANAVHNDSELNLLASAASSNPTLIDVDRDGASSPEESRPRPFHSRSREYPGGESSDEDEGGARESLVAHDSGSTRGGIRLIPSQPLGSPRR